MKVEGVAMKGGSGVGVMTGWVRVEGPAGREMPIAARARTEVKMVTVFMLPILSMYTNDREDQVLVIDGRSEYQNI